MRVLSPDGLWPFAKKRNGTVLAEGAGILMLEEYEHAKARGAPILAELMGYGMTADAADMVNPSIDGASTAMQIALDDSGLGPSDIDYINAHGTATAVNDINETRAIKRVFGNVANKLSISSTKSMHGHCLGAGGGIEAVAVLKAIEEKFVPPTVGLDEPDPECDLDYTPNAGKKREVNYAMSNSFAMMWSCTSTPSGLAAATICLVISISARDGVGSPDGWLCTSTIAVADNSRARLTTSRT
jgi:nodulation protein E